MGKSCSPEMGLHSSEQSDSAQQTADLASVHIGYRSAAESSALVGQDMLACQVGQNCQPVPAEPAATAGSAEQTELTGSADSPEPAVLTELIAHKISASNPSQNLQ